MVKEAWPTDSMNSGYTVSYAQVSDNSLKGKRILIAYFSWSGHTREVAHYIQSQVGGDLYEIVPQTPYVGSHRDVSNLAKQELDREYRPPIANPLPDLSQYDVVFIGYPIWWYQEPVVVDTFIETAGISGKYVIPFCTSGGSTIDKSEARIARLIPENQFIKGLTLSGSYNHDMIRAWLLQNGVL